MRITVNDIAHVMNIAQGTVSKALNGRPGISEELRAEVIKTASRLGYKVNRVAQSMSRAPVVIGVASPNIWQGHYGSIFKGINNRISLLGDYNIHVVTSEISGVNSADEIGKTLDGFIEQKVNGVVICPCQLSGLGALVEKLNKNNIAVVMIGIGNNTPFGSDKFSAVRLDGTMTGQLAGEYINDVVGRGADVACFIGNKDDLEHHDKLTAFTAEIQSHGNHIVAAYETQDMPELAELLIVKLLHEHPTLRGIYVATSNSLPICKYLRENGLSEKICLVATDVFDDIKAYAEDKTVSALIYQNPVRQGEIAVDVLYRYLAERKPLSANKVVYPEIVLRSNIDTYLNKCHGAKPD